MTRASAPESKTTGRSPIAGALALGLTCALTLAQPGMAHPAAPGPDLLPLTESDMTRSQETGCTFSFGKGNATLVQAIGPEVMVRTTGGLSLCRLDQAQVDAFTDGKRTLTCGGRLLRLRKTGATQSFPEADSAGWPASLSVSNGKTSRSVRGDAGVAC